MDKTYPQTKALCILAAALLCALPALAQNGNETDACGRTREDIQAALGDGVSPETLTAEHNECAGGTSTELQSRFHTTIPTGSINWEAIEACGYHPQRRELQCAIEVYQNTGFGGLPGVAPGSWEWVQFCVNYGAGLVPVNISAVHIHDNPGPAGPNWFYAVSVAADPTLHAALVNGQTLQARAILSWTLIPGGCGFIPIWGNQADFQIKLDP